MTSSPHGPYEQGFTRHTMVSTEGSEAATWSKSHKTYRSPDRSLQLDYVKSESLVIADQHAAVNTFPGLVHTARRTPFFLRTLDGVESPMADDGRVELPLMD